MTTPMRSGLAGLLAPTLVASVAGAGTIVVDPAGGGNFDNIVEATYG